MSTATIESRIRQFLLILSGLSFGVTVVELILEEHTKELLQLTPFVLCAIGAAAVIVALALPGRSTMRGLRAVMLIVAVGGLFGVAIHLRENVLFEQDIRPNALAQDVIINALKG